MMSKKQLACMLTLHIIYLLLGASIFYHIESPVEMQLRDEKKLERLEIQNLLYENYIPNDPEKQDSILRKLSDYCGKSMFNYTTEDEEVPIKWDFYHSFFFSYTVVSTIGYGNLSPTTHLSRILMIFYGLFGIPINGILLANLGEYFGLQLIKVYRKYKRKSEKRADILDYFFHNLGMLGQIFLYTLPGFLFFIFLPACIFVVFEGWDYVAAIYYAFVTLTTIGFGDIVAGTVNNGFAYGYFVIYQIFLIVWITFGLGYIVMLLGFITSGMRSEGVHKLEQKLAYQFKSTQNRILQGFSRDMNVIRKIINEANLIKLKPVYVEETPRLCRSVSCPEFTFDVEPRGPIFKRRRANSENIQLSSMDLLRIQSDTDLLGIDKEKTFNASAIVRPAELLARVVNVLGTFEEQRAEDQGVHMFEDEEILASEKPPFWSIGNDTIITNSPNSKRNRALSVAVPNYHKESVAKSDHDFTWANGENSEKYIEAMNHRKGGKLSLPTGHIEALPENNDSHPKRSILSRLFRKSSSTENPAEYIKNTMRGRGSVAPVSTESPKEKPRRGSIFPTLDLEAEGYKEKTKRGRHSIFPTFDFNQDEDDMAKAYKEKTKRGRHSIFPTFDFSQDEDDMAKAYKEKTKRGRHSIFPTFDFHQDEEDDMAKAYKEKTQRGRHSIFPTFDFSENEDDIAKNYKEKTKRGRHSIFPTFDFTENEDDKMAKAYKEKTKKGRHSIFPTFDFTEDDDDTAKAYREKTKHGRHSIFPTFDFSEDDDDDIAKKYKESTKKGRRSIFPSFNFGDKKEHDEDSINEDEIQSYQNRTRKGRGSLFPSFGKSKKHDQDDDIIPDDSEEIKNYQNKTKRGRASLFHSFGKERKGSNSEDGQSDMAADIKKYQIQTKRGRNSLFADDIQKYRDSVGGGRNSIFGDLESYKNKTKRGRPSLFDPDVNISELPQEEQVEVLEQTSVADLLRVLAVLESVSPASQHNPGSAEASRLADLIGGGSAGHPGTRRRGSIRPDFTMPARPEPEEAAGPRRRRISARAAAPQFTPTLATVVAGAELQTTAVAARENRMSMLAQPPPPPYTESAKEQEEAPQPRVRRYSPAPGGPATRSGTGPVPRLFTRMRKESASSIEEEGSSRRGSLTDIVIDNNKDNT